MLCGMQDVPPSRPTMWAVIFAALYLGLPVLGGLVLLDLALYGVVTLWLGRCYGVLCWF